MNYYLNKTTKLSFKKTIEKLEKLLKRQGFGILTEIDVKDTLKKKLDIEFRKYKILGVCNPPFAYKALLIEDKIGLLLPCNIIIQKNYNNTEVAIIDPIIFLSIVNNQDLAAIAKEVQNKFKEILDNL